MTSQRGRASHVGGMNSFYMKNRHSLYMYVVVLRKGDAWLVGVGKRAPHEFRCLWLVSPHGSLDRL